jgi:protease-4
MSRTIQPFNPKCFNNHMGLWLIEPMFFNRAFQALKAGVMKALPQIHRDALENPPTVKAAGTFEGPQGEESRMYAFTNGVAVIEVNGPMMKGESKYGDSCSTIMTRMALRQAGRDPGCTSVLMLFDSPGGTVAGTEDLANDVIALKNSKPVYGHVNDMCASAALWIATQCTKLSANATALVGSIGTLSVVEDTSKKMEMEGTRVIVVSTGEMKGSFTEGAPVSDAQIAYLQEIINQTNEFFLKGVATGRSMDIRNVRKAATGEMYLAGKAKDLGLIDSVQSADTTLQQMSQKFSPKKKESSQAVNDPFGIDADLVRVKNKKGPSESTTGMDSGTGGDSDTTGVGEDTTGEKKAVVEKKIATQSEVTDIDLRLHGVKIIKK